MKKILILFKIIFLITYVNVSAHAVISTPSPTTTLNKIAKSMSNSVKNDVQSIQKNSITTSDLINTSELTAGIQESAAKYGLTIDSEAASVLASIDTSSSKSISTALASLDANIGWLDDDYIQTVDQDTIVYDSEWQTLTKVTGGDLEYTTDENVFDPTKSQQMRAKVYVVDKSEARLKQLVKMFGDKIIPQQSDKVDLNKLVAEADLLVGGVLIPGAEAPKLVTKDMLKLMKRGSVIVDVAIDQGGCVETSKPTTHGDPTYIVDDVVHYCVANMPGGVPRTSTFALNKATLPYLVKLANKGYQKALGEDKNFLSGLNVYKGHVTYKAVADVFGHEYAEPGEAIKN